MSHEALGPGREFDAIRAWLAAWGSTARNIGDDAAVLDVPCGSRLVVSTDAAVEGVHFRREWLTPREVGYRACAAALSDLAAMGAAPLGVLVAVSCPTSWRDDLAEVMAGAGDAAHASGAPIIGGDTTGAGDAMRSADGGALMLAITVLGHCASPLTRAGAVIGDIIYVTGALGGPCAALTAWQHGAQPEPRHRARFAAPEPRIAAGKIAAAARAHAAMDVSDGLAADLRHVSAASHVRIELDVDRVPVFPGATRDDALAGGEEYELVIAAPSLAIAEFAADGIPLTAIGRVVAGAAEVIGLENGSRVALPEGYDHFSG